MSKTANKPAPIPFTTCEELQQFAQLAQQKSAICKRYEEAKKRAAATLASAAINEVIKKNKNGENVVHFVQSVTIDGWTLTGDTYEKAGYYVDPTSPTAYKAKAV